MSGTYKTENIPTLWPFNSIPRYIPKKVKVKVLVIQSCPTPCDPMDYSLSVSTVHGILQARILEWVAFPSLGDLLDLGIKPMSLVSPALQADSLPSEPSRKWDVKIYVHSKICTLSVDSSFTHTCYNLRATKIAFSKGVDKQIEVDPYILSWEKSI